MIQSMKRSAGAAGTPGGARPRRALIAAAAIFTASLAMSSAPGVAAGGRSDTAKYWKGKNISQVEKKFGNPTQMTPLTETGGTLYIYAHRDQPHWAFETDPGGKIIKAAKIE
jgi:hypothetical protein